MALKTNYKDAAWSGERQYQIRALGNGYSAITDQTAYTVQGDAFGAKDINDTNAAINKLNHTTEVTLYANSWSGSSAPYYQLLPLFNLLTRRPIASSAPELRSLEAGMRFFMCMKSLPQTVR